jgi:hypothetical protein
MFDFAYFDRYDYPENGIRFAQQSRNSTGCDYTARVEPLLNNLGNLPRTGKG